MLVTLQLPDSWFSPLVLLDLRSGRITHLAGEYHVARKTIIRDLQGLIRRRQLDQAVYPEWNVPGAE